MPKINVLNIAPGDNQTILIDKINYNFDQILTAGGGPQGPQGIRGATGAIGPQGIQGPVGPQGQKGARWYVQSAAPAFGTVVHSPWGEPELGDYWLADSNDPNPYGIYVYNDNGTGTLNWEYSGVFFNNSSLFTAFDNTNADVDRVILHDDINAPNYSLVISDYAVTTGDIDYTYDELPYTQFGINSEKAKLKIATDHTTRTLSLLSFGRANMDNANANSSQYSRTVNPRFEWKNLSVGTDYDIKFNVPNSNYDIELTGPGKVFYSKASYVNLEGTAQVNITGPNVSIRRNGAGNLFNNYGTGDYYAEGNKIRYKPDYSTSTGNFIIGSDVTTPGTKGLVVSSIGSASGSGNSLVFKADATASNKYYGRVIAEKQSSATPLAGIGFAVDLVDNSNNTRIDFSVSSVSKGLDINRLTLDSDGNLQFKFGSLTGTSKNAKIYMQTAGTSDPGANLSVSAGDAVSGIAQGGTIEINGGLGGLNPSTTSGDVIINPGNTVKGNSNPNAGAIYLHNNFPLKGNNTGVAIGINTSTDVNASLVISDVNPNMGVDILQIKTQQQRSTNDYFFGFDSDGYVSRGLPYNPNLYDANSGTGYQLSADPTNLDYYIEGDWGSTLTLQTRGDATTTGWDPSLYLTVLRSRFTRIGDTVQVDFVAKINITSPLPTGYPASDGVMYIAGLPYKPDFDRGAGIVYDYNIPVMPRFSVKAANIVQSATSTVAQSQIPAGTIIAWAGPTATKPNGWAVCDGTKYNKVAAASGPGYPDLFAAIGSTYNVPLTPTTQFCVPDYRGKFLRGLGSVGGISTTQASAALGAVQQDSLKSHTHTIDGGGDAYIDDVYPGNLKGRQNQDNRMVSYTTSATGDVETRPVNQSVNYLIYLGKSTDVQSTTVTTTNIPQMDLGAAFVYENSSETRLYLYNDGGTFNLDNFPANGGGTSYLSGSFSYFTQDSTTYAIPGCTTPTWISVEFLTSNQLKFKWRNGFGSPTTFIIEASLNNTNWITLHNNLPPTSPGVVIVPTPAGYPNTTGDLKTYFRITQNCASGPGAGSATYTYQATSCVAPTFVRLDGLSSSTASLVWTSGTGVTDTTAVLVDYSIDGGTTWSNNPGGFGGTQPVASTSPYTLVGLQSGWKVRIHQICSNNNQPVYAVQTWQFTPPATLPINQYIYRAGPAGNRGTVGGYANQWFLTVNLTDTDPATFTPGIFTAFPDPAVALCPYDVSYITGTYRRADNSIGTWQVVTSVLTGGLNTTIALNGTQAKFYMKDPTNSAQILTSAQTAANPQFTITPSSTPTIFCSSGAQPVQLYLNDALGT